MMRVQRAPSASLVAARFFSAKTAPTYKDYVERKQKESETPLSKKEWESRVLHKRSPREKPDTGTREIKDPSAWGEEHFGAWAKDLSSEQRSAVKNYAAGNYIEINSALRESKGEKLSPEAKNLEQAISSSPGAPHAFTAYRRIYFAPGADKDQFKPGGTFLDHGFMSTAVGKTITGFGEVTLKINVPKGTKGAYLGQMGLPGQNEFLLQRGTHLRIDRVEGDVFEVTVVGE